MSLGNKQYVNNPIVNGLTATVRIATSAANDNLGAAIEVAAIVAGTSLDRCTGMLISANASDIYLRSGQGFVTTVGVKIVQNTNLFLPLNGSSANISYEGTTPDIMLFFD